MKAKLKDLIALNNWMLDAPLEEARPDIKTKKAAMTAIRELPSSFNYKLVWASDTQIDWDASVDQMRAETVLEVEDVADPEPVAKKEVAKKARRKPFEWPANPDGVKAHRPGTKRAHVVETLTGDGATFEEIQAHCGWDRRTCYEGIKLIHSILGYGLTEDSDTGIIRAFVA